MSPPRSRLRQVALVATTLGVLWALVIVIFGGFDLNLFGRTLTSNEPLRPLIWASVAFAIFVWANGTTRTDQSLRRFLARVTPWPVALVLAAGATALAWSYNTTVANASDAYGYVSQADLWLSGNLKVDQPWVADVPWPNARWSFTPLGYRPVERDGSTEIVPTYSPGFPLLMAGAKLIAGHCAMFLTVPIMSGVLVLATYGIGVRLGSRAIGLIAAWLVAASPAVLFMAVLPMIDVPVAAMWTTAVYLALGRNTAAPAGLAAALAVLIRPNLAPLAGVIALWFLIRQSDDRSSWVRRLRDVALFGAGLAPGVIATAIVYQHLYGSPVVSGYGRFGEMFAWESVLPNVRNYLSWVIESQTLVPLLGLAIVAVPLKRFWPSVPDRRVFLIIGLFVLVLWAQYVAYLVFDEWWFLRFLLPSWPFMMLGVGAAATAAFRSRSAMAAVLAVWFVIFFGIYSWRSAAHRGVFTFWRSDAGYVATALRTRSLTPPDSVVFSMLHSGSLRYYGGRLTMRYDLLDREWLDRSVDWLAGRGIRSYALINESELAEFRRHWDGTRVVQALDGTPMFTYPGPPVIYLFDLGQQVPPTMTETLVGQTDTRCAPPAPPPQLVLR